MPLPSVTWRCQPLLPQSHLGFIFTAGEPRAPSQHHPWDLGTWAGRLRGSTGQGPATFWPHFDIGQSLTFQLHLKINTWMMQQPCLGFPPLREISLSRILLRWLCTGRLPHTTSAVAFTGPAGKSRPNWELEHRAASTLGSSVAGSHQVRSRSTAVSGGEMDTCPKGAQMSRLQVWMVI